MPVERKMRLRRAAGALGADRMYYGERFNAVSHLLIVGSLQDLRPRNDARILSVVIYLLMGWAAVVALVPMVNALGRAGFAWVASGGLLRTVGIGFYALDARLKHAHGIRHLFVLAGSAAHFIAILMYVP
jgi:hemolysin III